ncbi:MAG: 3-deoxy-7-phosphoheptulonate synthase [Anaerolineae bacterium]|nr:3-deoxy-7-phosphoheptulonate synthase [Anaerolineae bacterium]
MIIVMKRDATQADVEAVIERVHSFGLRTHVSVGEERTIVGIIGDERNLPVHQIERLNGVERAVPILHPFKLASSEFVQGRTVIQVGNVRIGGEEIVVMAGPCAVESREQLLETALAVKKAGAQILRGGAFKPRTSPYSFQGLGKEGLEYLAEARALTGLPVVTEVISPTDVELVSQYADILQIGARNSQNFALLHEVGLTRKPVLLKRGMMSRLEEFLMSAEYVLAAGNPNVILCERGIRTFETYTRNTVDINAVPVLKQLSHLPVLLDPSHGTGKWDLVPAVAKAAIAAGADGLLIEVHPRPEEALSDGMQSLKPDKFAALMRDLARVAQAVDRKLTLEAGV